MYPRLISTFLEPVASVMPKFSSSETTKGFTSKSNQSVTLLCPAQAYPVPLFRYDIFLYFIVYELILSSPIPTFRILT